RRSPAGALAVTEEYMPGLGIEAIDARPRVVPGEHVDRLPAHPGAVLLDFQLQRFSVDVAVGQHQRLIGFATADADDDIASEPLGEHVDRIDVEIGQRQIGF
ncbi:hypothetical protein RZS08_03955, partial [Arthrospira platensis SPKY1]|nr:hypothetical protein [Arthrospira platensis SPKY1]